LNLDFDITSELTMGPFLSLRKNTIAKYEAVQKTTRGSLGLLGLAVKCCHIAVYLRGGK
jgi:hypothetical protein